jgi:uncharacterized protein YutE (UPF0331/DUF86 family)
VGEVNFDRLRDLAGHLRKACRQLREVGNQGVEAFLSDAKTANSAKYLLIAATEAALDICNHLAAKIGGRSPEDYADCMKILSELGYWSLVFPYGWAEWPDFALFSFISSHSSLLIYLYWRVDDREVIRVIQEHLDDFENYLLAVGRYLKNEI